MGSNNINGGHDNNAAEWNALAASPAKVLGWFGIYTWRQFETSDGVYDFSMLVTHFNALQAKRPGARFGAQIWCEAFSGTTVSFGIPQYILTNSFYGPGQDGIHFGYWTDQNGGGFAAIWRAQVNERYTRMFENLATTSFVTTAGPYAGQTFTFDTHPLIEAWFDQESSLAVTAGSDYNESTFANLSVARYIRSAAAFKNTTFAALINDMAGSPPSVGVAVTGAYNNRGAMAWPDTNGIAQRANGTFPGITWGQHFYSGDTWNGSAFVSNGTNLKGRMGALAWIESPDYNVYTAPDLFDGLEGLKATHGIITYVTTGNGTWTTNILPLINARILSNTAYPDNYPQS